MRFIGPEIIRRQDSPIRPLGFLSRPLLEDTGKLDFAGRIIYRVTRPLTFEGNFGAGVFRLTVPEGYETNLASTPRLLWPIFPPFGIYSPAAIGHDFLCEMNDCSKFLADAAFREMMDDLGTPTWLRVTMYYGVRANHTTKPLRKWVWRKLRKIWMRLSLSRRR